MAKFFSSVSGWLRFFLEPRPAPPGDERAWRIDPLSHPAITPMGARELADLPFPRDLCVCPSAACAAGGSTARREPRTR